MFPVFDLIGNITSMPTTEAATTPTTLSPTIMGIPTTTDGLTQSETEAAPKATVTTDKLITTVTMPSTTDTALGQ